MSPFAHREREAIGKAQLIRKKVANLSPFAYVLGMSPLDRFVDDQLRNGRATFSRADAQAALALQPAALKAALTRLAKRQRLASPRNGFFLILRPEDQPAGAPDPAQWIDPLMRYLGLDYRVSLLRAAAFHGSSHQAAMVFQVVAPRQLRDIDIGAHRIQFVYQAPAAFGVVNDSSNLDKIKTPAGFANVAGLELTLLDCARYYHHAAGINGLAQVVKDLGGKADPRKLAKLAGAYENACVRRLGYLLECAHHARQADALDALARKAKTAVPLDPAVKPLLESLATQYEKSRRWKLVLNEPVEVDF